MSGKYSRILNALIPQSRPLNDQQVRNAAGGYVYSVDDWARLDRFLLLGTTGGTYYTGERRLTEANAKAVVACIVEDGTEVVDRIIAIDTRGRAPKKSPAVFALALCMKHGNDATREKAYSAIPAVCRTASHVFELVAEIDGIGKGWSRGLRRGVASWFTRKSEDALAFQVIKYGSRSGYTARDLLRLSHPKTDSQVLRWVAKGGEFPHAQIEAAEKIKTASVSEAVSLIVDNRLPREAIPTTMLNEVSVWEALLVDMPVTAMVRNLGKMSSVGLIGDGSEASATVIDRLSDLDRLRNGRVHPLSLLVALKVYAQGRGVKGSLTWKPDSRVSAALSEAITLSFGALPESKRREMTVIDISGSMHVCLRDFGNLMLHEAAACMAIATVSANPRSTVAWFGTSWGVLDVHGRRWDDIARELGRFNQGTDFCQAIFAAQGSAGEKPELVTVFTDNETWAGRQHPEQAWASYKKAVPRARCVVASMTASGEVAMPKSDDVLQVVGFDTALPEVIDAFAG